MKALVAALVAALAFTSPTFAKTTRIAEAQKCVKLDQAAKDVAGPGITTKKLVGDDLKAFNAKVTAKIGLTPPADQDGIVIVRKEGSEMSVLIFSRSGCVSSVSAMPPSFFEKLDKPPVDGSI
jgi:hypothetical protein